MIERRLMSVGQWDLTLKPTTPRSIRRALAISTDEGHGFGTVVFLPGRFDLADLAGSAIAADDPSDLYARAEHVGVHRRTEGLTISGPGLEMYLSDEDGKTDSVQPTPGTRDFDGWVNHILSTSTVPSGGDVQSTLTTSETWEPEYGINQRDALDYICRQYGAEWRMNNDLTLDAGLASYLYSADPVAIVSTVGRQGRDLGGLIGLDGTVSAATHLERYAEVVWVWDDAGNFGTEQRVSSPYRDPFGIGHVPALNLTDGSVDPADLDARATARIVYGDDVLADEYIVEVTTDRLSDVGEVGGYLYVFDPPNLLLDKTNELVHRGETQWPKRLRIYAAEVPVKRRMGVALALWTPLLEVHDLTPWVDWTVEADAPLRLEVGSPVPSWLSAARQAYDDWLTR